MRKIHAERYQHGKKLSYSLHEKAFIDVFIAGQEPVIVIGKRTTDDAEIVLANGSDFRFRHNLIGFSELVLTSSKPLSATGNVSAKQMGEPLDDKVPPKAPELSPSANLVAQLQHKANTERRALHRDTVLDPLDIDLSFDNHEASDVPIFEEEELLNARTGSGTGKSKSAGSPSGADDMEADESGNDTGSDTEQSDQSDKSDA